MTPAEARLVNSLLSALIGGRIEDGITAATVLADRAKAVLKEGLDGGDVQAWAEERREMQFLDAVKNRPQGVSW